LALWLGFFLLPPAVFSKSFADSKQKLEREKNRLERLRIQIQETQTENDAVEKEALSLLRRLEISDKLLQFKRKELLVNDLQMKENNNEIAALSLSVKNLQEEMEKKRNLLSQRLRSSYIMGKEASLHLMLEAKNGEELDRRYRYLMKIAEREADLLDNYKASLMTLETEKEQLKEVQKSNLAIFQGNASKIEGIQKGQDEKRQFLAKLKEEIDHRKGILLELEESALNLQELIETLEKKKGSKTFGKGFLKRKGLLDWPSVGEVITFFGRQKHVKFDTLVFKKGIEIGGNHGEPIQAVYGAKVVYAEWFKGYGILIVLDHGEGYYTLYGHASERLVSVGNRVREGQLIGHIGETGFTQQTKLYFEIRHRGKPIDPLQWLKVKLSGGSPRSRDILGILNQEVRK